MKKDTLSVVGMFNKETGNDVKDAIRNTLGSVVEKITVNPEEQTVTCVYDDSKIDLDDIKDAIIVNGYTPEP